MEKRNSATQSICSATFLKEKIHTLLAYPERFFGKKVEIYGWIRSFREQKSCFFLHINDGSCFASLQILPHPSFIGWEKEKSSFTTGASVRVEGIAVKSPGAKQPLEIQATKIEILGECPAEEYPLQKKHHSFEFLRTMAHLRGRTNTQGAIARIRSHIAGATHAFFQEKGFLFLPTPILTSSDCEGGGELFQVTTLDPLNSPPSKDYSEDFFKKAAYLTVSGQLNAECYACSVSHVYTFGPTFRAENSNTYRHLAEFWMIEPEMAFCDLSQAIQVAQAYLKHIAAYLMKKDKEDLIFFDTFIEKGLLKRLEKFIEKPFKILSYTEAITHLQKAPKSFTFPVKWGCDLQSEHERYLAEELFQKPVVLINYPKEIKAFYMRDNEDGKTVAAFDIIVPKIGELVGGSQREERYPILQEKIEKQGLSPHDYWWYLELRKYGSVPHAGFGAGFERMIQCFTGIENIREVHPFPRYPGHIDF